jgi:S-DNA-T family DNA segregation ATPase FtsK/SpoIIIE
MEFSGMTSGKSVLMQNLILSIACTNTLEQARIVLIDPKLGVDYFAFEGLPHLGEGLIENQQDAIAALSGPAPFGPKILWELMER